MALEYFLSINFIEHLGNNSYSTEWIKMYYLIPMVSTTCDSLKIILK